MMLVFTHYDEGLTNSLHLLSFLRSFRVILLHLALSIISVLKVTFYYTSFYDIFRCNIYIRQQETSTVHDIFLAPFSVRLVACVVAVVLIAAMAIVGISRMTSTASFNNRRMGYPEALIWSTGILCQQGSLIFYFISTNKISWII